jgi:hypothetical protein
MKAILEGIFGETSMPLRWYCFGLGVVFSLVLRFLELPALGFALGMYLPIELNTPLMLGGVLSYYVNRPKAGTSEADGKARENRGVLIASGLMAGGAIMGVVSSFIKLKWKEGFPILSKEAAEGAIGEWLALAALVALCTYVVVYSRKAVADPDWKCPYCGKTKGHRRAQCIQCDWADKFERLDQVEQQKILTIDYLTSTIIVVAIFLFVAPLLCFLVLPLGIILEIVCYIFIIIRFRQVRLFWGKNRHYPKGGRLLYFVWLFSTLVIAIPCGIILGVIFGGMIGGMIGRS